MAQFEDEQQQGEQQQDQAEVEAPQPEQAQEQPETVAATKPSAEDIKQGLELAGKDVSGVWDDVVGFAAASVDALEVGIKKALEFIGHEAASAVDAVIALLKHK